MNIKAIKGLKYPDEYFIKFFFKFGLHTKNPLKFLELGCSNGCNLMLAYEYAHSVVGVDFEPMLIEYANENFALLNKNNSYDFYAEAMREFCASSSDIQADVLLLISSIYYIPKEDFIKQLQNIKCNKLIKKNIPFFIRVRELDDFRYAKGEKVEENSYILQNGVTGEDGVFCAFYETQEMIDILQKELGLRDFQTMHLQYDNIQNGVKVKSSEVVIWGTIN